MRDIRIDVIEPYLTGYMIIDPIDNPLESFGPYRRPLYGIRRKTYTLHTRAFDVGGSGGGGGGRAIINNSDIPLYMRGPEIGNEGNDLEGTFVDITLTDTKTTPPGAYVVIYDILNDDGPVTQISIQINYYQASDLYTEINAIQTVTTNCPILPGDCKAYMTEGFQSYNDPPCGPNKDEHPFIYSMDDSAPLSYKGLQAVMSEAAEKVDFMFKDTPYRKNYPNYEWSAELSIVGKNSSGIYEVLETIKYGFTVNDYKVKLIDYTSIKSSSFTPIHRKTLKASKIKF